MKKKLLTLLMGTSLVMGLAACGGGEDDGKDTASGGEQKIYDQKCSGCHGGELQGAMGPELKTIGSKYSKEEILDILKNGKGQMPANVVSGDDAESLAGWLAEKK